MKLLRQVLIIFSICIVGEILSKILKLPIPGNVMGMIILLICLMTGIIKIQYIDKITDFLLDNLAFFFIPAGVSLLAYLKILKGSLIYIVIISFISTIVILLITGKLVEFLKGEK